MSFKHSQFKKRFLSIIIPHWNTPDKLRRLLESIPFDLSIEVIVVDDNSDLGLEAEHLQNDFRCCRFYKNPGPDHNAGSARNYGLTQAKGEWIVFADADDYFLVDGLGSIIEAAQSADNDVDIIFFNVTSWDDTQGLVGSRHYCTSGRIKQFMVDSDELALRYLSPSPCAKAIRKSLLDQHGIRFDSSAVSNDVIFSLLCGHMARKISAKDSVVYTITQSDTSLTARLTPERALSRLHILIRKNRFLLQWGIRTRLDWGLTYFLVSVRCNNYWKKKVMVYKSYIALIVMRVWLFR